MSRSLSLSRPASRPLVLTAITCGALAGSAGVASAAQFEQVSRADGVAGASPVAGGAAEYPEVASDGRNAYFTFVGGKSDWAAAGGLYRRDIVANRTIRIAAGEASRLTGITADDAVVSFTTPSRLVSADTNSSRDLYSYTVATGKIDLISRADGVNGAALGLTSSAFITRGGKVALFGTAYGIGRRDLATGKTVKIGDGKLGGNGWSAYGRADTAASADGSAYLVDDKLVSPRGIDVLGTNETSLADISENGQRATWWSLQDPNKMHVITVATGARSSVAIDYDGGDQPLSHGIEPDGSGYRLSGIDGSGDRVVRRVDLLTGVKTTLPIAESGVNNNISPNGKFATVALGAHGAVFVTAAAGVALPGGADLPSPAVYVGFLPGCARNPFPAYPYQPSQVGAYINPFAAAPTAASVNLKAYTTTGAKIGEITFTSDGWVPVRVPSPLAAYKLVATVKLVDGRSLTESWTMPYIPSNERCYS